MGKNTNISVFLDKNGRIEKVPIPERTKIPLLAYLAEKFEPDRDYTEKEVNSILNEWHTFGDFYILRRLLVDYDFLDRTLNGARYWVVKKEIGAPEDCQEAINE